CDHFPGIEELSFDDEALATMFGRYPPPWPLTKEALAHRDEMIRSYPMRYVDAEARVQKIWLDAIDCAESKLKQLGVKGDLLLAGTLAMHIGVVLYGFLSDSRYKSTECESHARKAGRTEFMEAAEV